MTAAARKRNLAAKPRIPSDLDIACGLDQEILSGPTVYDADNAALFLSLSERRFLRLVELDRLPKPLEDIEDGPWWDEADLERSLGHLEGEDRSGIYFVHSKTTNLVKIGFSREPRARLTNLRVASPCALRMLTVIDGTREDEKRLHKRFRSLRSHGEWFHFLPAIKKFLNSHADNP